MAFSTSLPRLTVARAGGPPYTTLGGTMGTLLLFAPAMLADLPRWAPGVLGATAVAVFIGSMAWSERAMRGGSVGFNDVVFPREALPSRKNLAQRLARYRRLGLFVTLGLYAGFAVLIGGAYVFVRMGWDPPLQTFLAAGSGLVLLLMSVHLGAEEWLVASLGLTCPGCGTVLVGDTRWLSRPLAQNTLETSSCWECGRRVAT